jgi:predicted mannosyl-3-phosphoglycerate phosphatase (HAD superfamily)
MRPQSIVFAPLDGMLTALGTRSFEGSLPLLEFVHQERIPLILCSAGTRAEMEPWRSRLAVFDPFISESGGGVFIPYDSIALHDLQAVCPRIQITSGYYVLVLGTPHAVLAGMFDMIRAEGFEVRGLKDMDVTEVMQLTGPCGATSESPSGFRRTAGG